MCLSSSWTNHVGELLVVVSHISGLIDMDRLSWWRGFMRLGRLATSWWSVVGDHLGDGWPLISWSSYYVFPSKGGNVFQTLRWYPPLKDTRDCWHQENGTSSLVRHRPHKSQRQKYFDFWILNICIELRKFFHRQPLNASKNNFQFLFSGHCKVMSFSSIELFQIPD